MGMWESLGGQKGKKHSFFGFSLSPVPIEFSFNYQYLWFEFLAYIRMGRMPRVRKCKRKKTYEREKKRKKKKKSRKKKPPKESFSNCWTLQEESWEKFPPERVDMVVLFCSFKTNRKFAQKNRTGPCYLFCSFSVQKLEQLFAQFAQFAHNSHNPNKIHTLYKIRTNSHNSHNWNKIRTIWKKFARFV